MVLVTFGANADQSGWIAQRLFSGLVRIGLRLIAIANNTRRF
jgi:hypothetical protein